MFIESVDTECLKTNRARLTSAVPTAEEADGLPAVPEPQLPCFLQLVRPLDATKHVAKTFAKIGEQFERRSSFDNIFKTIAEEHVPLQTADQAFRAVTHAAQAGGSMMLLGRPNADGVAHQNANGWLRKTKNIQKDGALAHFDEVPRRLYMIDIDPTPALTALFQEQNIDIFSDPQQAIKKCCQAALPELWRSDKDQPVCDMLVQLSSSCGMREVVKKTCYELDGSYVRLHVFVWLSELLAPAAFKDHVLNWNRTLADDGLGESLDTHLYQAVQPHYIADPKFVDCDDPLSQRYYRFQGSADALVLPRLKQDELASRTNQPGAVDGSNRTNFSASATGACVDWPDDWRACLARVKPGSSHKALLETTKRLVDTLLRDGVISLDTEPWQALADPINEINGHIDAVSFYDTPANIVHRKEDARTLLHDWYLKRRARRVARQREREKVAQRVPMTFQDEGMEPQKAVAETRAAVEGFIKAALENRSAFQRALAHHRQPGWSFETHGLDLGGVNPPLHVLAADGGLGKSRAVIDYLLKYVDLTVWRVLVFQPDHKRCDEFAADFNDAKPEDVPEAFVIQGRRPPLCDAPDDIDGIAKQVEALGWSARKVACPKCPNRKGCDYLAQFERNGPGLYLAPHVYLRTRSIPGFSRDDFVGEGTGAPILAVIIDEQFDPGYVGQKISRDALSVPFIMPDGIYDRDETEHAEQRARDLQRRLLELLEEVTDERITNEQLVRHKLDSFWTRDTSNEFLWSGEARRALGEIKCTLRDLHQACEYEAAETVRRGPMTVSKSLVAAWSLLQKLVDILNVIERGADVRDWLFLHGLRVKESTIELDWMHGLRKEFFRVPLLALDGTMSLKRAETCFTYWQGFNAQLVEPYWMQFTRIRSAHGAHATYLKVLDAPSSKSNISTVRDHVEYADDNEAVVSTTRARRDAHPEALIRALWPITRRSGSAGLLSHKLFTDYIGDRLPNTLLGHFGAQRGRNDWKNVDLLSVVGQHRPPIDVLERQAEAWSTLDAERRPIAFTGRYQNEARGLRVTDGLGGVRVLTISHADAFVRMVLEQYEAEHLQALWRARGIWRTADNPVLILDLSSECPDVTYDAVIQWSALAAVNEFGAVLHGAGVLPEKPADTAKLAPGLFRNNQQVKELLRENQLLLQYKTVGSAYNTNYIKGLPTLLQNAVHFNFSPDTVISGKPVEHRLLSQPEAEPVVVDLPRRKPMQALIDRERIRGAEEARSVLLESKTSAGCCRLSTPSDRFSPHAG